MITRSWDGARTTQIAAELGCHPQTVRERLARFAAEGVDGLADRPGGGRPPRLTEHERSQIVALARSTPPGRLHRKADGTLAAAQEREPAHWTLDALTPPPTGWASRSSAARCAGSSCASGCAGAHPAPGPAAPTPTSPKRTRVVALDTHPPEGATVVCADELGPVVPRTFPPAPGWSTDGHRSKASLEYGRGEQRVWVYGALRVRRPGAHPDRSVAQHRRLEAAAG
jgi:hypothetical protein